ncbi:hypothetical protein D1818_11210 [Aquimarina sp. BL5]|uniref:hypothetical protein n=1 Tax=Aquimarina sp. BL5 TaxID=1714860 RepID=UPI000E50FFBD|nr:hypothetical protein [Aquimarina sp. BL5]AXT51371.1 hypothetical protein D1818_11210 [Aquimarina sp. BL5]RKN05469.1 hypothetical protein D7036_10510 [Aquimarina sp. BL5]
MLKSKLLIGFIFFLFFQYTNAQEKDEAIFFAKRDQITKFHTINDLENLKKGELIKLYQDRVREIVTVIPFLSLTNEPGVRLGDLGIKEDSGHIKSLKKSSEATKEAINTAQTSIEELVPYADTEKIILTILYYEEIIKKMRIGVTRSF